MIVTLWLTGCGMGGSEAVAPCPPVVEYSTADQARAADDFEALPEGAVVIRMLSDYTVMRTKRARVDDGLDRPKTKARFGTVRDPKGGEPTFAAHRKNDRYAQIATFAKSRVTVALQDATGQYRNPPRNQRHWSKSGREAKGRQRPVFIHRRKGSVRR